VYAELRKHDINFSKSCNIFVVWGHRINKKIGFVAIVFAIYRRKPHVSNCKSNRVVKIIYLTLSLWFSGIR
jgi:hypothetical protein